MNGYKTKIKDLVKKFWVDTPSESAPLIFNTEQNTTSTTLLKEPSIGAWLKIDNKAWKSEQLAIVKMPTFHIEYQRFFEAISGPNSDLKALLPTFTKREQQLLLISIRKSIGDVVSELINNKKFNISADFSDSLKELQNQISTKVDLLNQSNQYSSRRIKRILYDTFSAICAFAAAFSFLVFCVALEPTLLLSTAGASIIFFACSYFFDKLSEAAQNVKLSDEDTISLQTQVRTFFSVPQSQQATVEAPNVIKESLGTELSF